MEKIQSIVRAAKKLIGVIDQATELAREVFSREDKYAYNTAIERLGGEINALAIECGLANEADLPYTSGMLSWHPSLVVREVSAVMGGIEKLFPQIGRLHTLRGQAKLLLESGKQNEQPKKPTEAEQNTAPAKDLSKELEKPEVGTQAYPGPRRQVPTSDADRQRAFLGGYTVGEYKYAPDLPRGETATKQNTTPAKRCGIWTLVKRIPRWIYVLVIFLAALLTCIYLLWWLWTIFLA